MTAHKHAEMIKAKADNMELVVFIQVNNKWQEYEGFGFPAFSRDNYFACLPQHKEACLHWLNGGDVEEKGFCADDKYFDDPFKGEPNPFKWYNYHVFMDDGLVIRIKPKNEKRYIGVKDNGYSTKHFATQEEVKQYIKRRGFIADLYKITTIEIEV